MKLKMIVLSFILFLYLGGPVFAEEGWGNYSVIEEDYTSDVNISEEESIDNNDSSEAIETNFSEEDLDSWGNYTTLEEEDYFMEEVEDSYEEIPTKSVQGVLVEDVSGKKNINFYITLFLILIILGIIVFIIYSLFRRPKGPLDKRK